MDVCSHGVLGSKGDWVMGLTGEQWMIVWNYDYYYHYHYHYYY